MNYKSLSLSIFLISVITFSATQATIYLPFVAGAAGAVGYGIRDAQLMGSEAIKKEVRESKFRNSNCVDERTAAELLSSKPVKKYEPSIMDSVYQELLCLKKGIPLTLNKSVAGIQKMVKSLILVFRSQD